MFLAWFERDTDLQSLYPQLSVNVSSANYFKEEEEMTKK